MRYISFLLLLSVAACDDHSPAVEPAPPSWGKDLQRFCQSRDDEWLSTILRRIESDLPNDFVSGSLQFEGLNVQAPFDGRTNAKELQLRLIADRREESVQLSAYGTVAIDRCNLQELEVIEGYDRFDPPMRFRVSENNG